MSQALSPAHGAFEPQKPLSSGPRKQKHAPNGSLAHSGNPPPHTPGLSQGRLLIGDPANAGVRKLEITGVVHAIAPATPIRFNIDRRETDPSAGLLSLTRVLLLREIRR